MVIRKPSSSRRIIRVIHAHPDHGRRFERAPVRLITSCQPPISARPLSLSLCNSRSVGPRKTGKTQPAVYIYSRPYRDHEGSKKGSTRLAVAKKWWIRVRNEARWRGRSMLPAWHIQSYEGLLSAVMTIGRQMAAAIKTRLTAAPYSPYNTFLHPSISVLTRVSPLHRSLSLRPSLLARSFTRGPLEAPLPLSFIVFR